jgi:WD40 repeat protein
VAEPPPDPASAVDTLGTTPATEAAGPSPSLASLLAQAGKLSRLEWLALLRADQGRRWQRGERLPAEAYLAQLPPLRADAETAVDLIYSEVLLREGLGESPRPEEYLRRFPEFAAQLRSQFELHQALATGALPTGLGGTPQPGATPAEKHDVNGSEKATLPPVPVPLSGAAPLGPEPAGQVAELLLHEQRAGWARGDRPLVETYLRRHPALAADKDALLDLINHEVVLRTDGGEVPNLEEYQARFPDLGADLELLLEVHQVLEVEGLAATATAAFGGGASPAAPSIPGYEILGELGRGGMGVVYRARQTKLNRLVALKMILAGAHAGEDDRRRFLPEAEAVARLQHPNIVQIHEVGEADGHPFFSLEFCPGGSLAAKLAGTPLPPGEAARLVEVLARAVQAAHEAGVVHRDLKPANVLLSLSGRSQSGADPDPGSAPLSERPLNEWVPKVTDFGLAKKLDDAAGPTASGAIMGTPSYMSPEQAAGKAKQIGPAADVYALGAVLYELLTGHPPFKAATALDTVLQVVSEAPVPPGRLQPKLPRDLETVCLKCLHKEPHRRYASAEALADDLRRFLDGEPVRARPVGAWEQAAKWAKRRPAVAALAAALVGVTALGFGLVTWQWQRAERAGHTAAERADAEGRARQEAAAALERAESELYLHLLSSAQREWLIGRDVRRARQLLDECPAARRRWEWHYLRRLFEGGRLTLRGHEAPVTCVAFGPKGYLASGGEDGTVRVWDAAGQEARTFHAAGKPLQVLFSADGRRLAALSGPGRPVLQVWDPVAGKEVFALRDAASWMALSPDGRRLATGTKGTTVTVWDLTTGREGLTLRGHTLPALDAAFSPDGSYLACACGATGDDQVPVLGVGERAAGGPKRPGEGNVLLRDQKPGEVKLWDARTGAEVLTLRGHGAPVLAVVFSPDGRQLASASWDQTVKVWDARTGKVLHTLTGHTDAVRGLAFVPGGRRLVSCGGDRAVKIWDTASGREVCGLTGNPGTRLSTAVSPDGRALALAGGEGQQPGDVTVWGLADGKPVHTLRGHAGPVRSLAFSPDGRRLASAGADGTVKVWDVGIDPEALTLATGGDGLAFSPDGRCLASGSDDTAVKLWDARTGRELATLSGHTAGVRAAAFSPDGRLLATAARDFGEPGEVKLWDARARKELLTLPGQPGVGSMAFSPDGSSLALPGENHTVTVWDAAAGKPLVTLSGQRAAVSCVAFAPDGRQLAVASRDGTVALWDVTSGRLIRTFRGQPEGITSVAFRCDGRRLASTSGSRGSVVTVWSTETGEELLRLKAEAGASCVVFHPDGSRLISGGVKGAVQVWDAMTGQELLTLVGHRGSVTRVIFSPDGQRLASLSTDGVIKLWDGAPVSIPALGE